jgi:hypothetical protein
VEHRLTLPPPTAKLSATRSRPMTFDPKSLDDLARRLADAVPPGLTALKNDLEQNFKAVLQSGLARLDLVTRQEFDIQAAVKEVHNRGWPRIDDHRPLEVKGSGSGLYGTVLFENLNGIYRKPKFEPSLLRFWLVLERAE